MTRALGRVGTLGAAPVSCGGASVLATLPMLIGNLLLQPGGDLAPAAPLGKVEG